MSPRRKNKATISPQQVQHLLRKTDRLCKQSARVREEARGGLISHFQHETEILPVPEDQERRARMARKHR